MEYGLIGYPLGHSYSKLIHEHIEDINYELHPLNEEEFPQFMEEKNFKGINVTIPYKQKVIPYLDEIDEVAQEINAVNVIVSKDKHLKGYNTDAFGLENLMKYHHVQVKNKKVLILGTGGTSKTAAYVLRKLGAHDYYFVTREDKKGAITYDKANKMMDIDIIINTTPRGMYPHEDDTLLIDLKAFPYLECVIDVVYNPFRTKLLLEAKKRNVKAVSGLYMLVSQAIRALELFLDKTYDESVYAETYFYLLKQTVNFVFIGMPSSGKSTASVNFALANNLKCFDSDEEIEKDEGKVINEIFASRGEAYFRTLEANKLKELSLQKGVVIATGGGAMMNEESANNLMRNGYVIFLNRSLEDLKRHKASAMVNRPLLQKDVDAFDKLYKKRYAQYVRCADYIIENNGSKQQTLATILKHFK